MDATGAGVRRFRAGAPTPCSTSALKVAAETGLTDGGRYDERMADLLAAAAARRSRER